ncbi:hypothetical protein [Altererythrobacter sp. MF3-039]|uniref:hypothetical protein n=1 Tax=Altererythrobacter sp. MF3-039 TaxID=3252901 RepID=UPI00390C8B92
MNLIDYFRGRRLLLRSPLSKEEAKRRINAASGPPFWPFRSGVRGRVWGEHLRLSYTDFWLIDYNAKPILAGRLHNALGSCELFVNFRAPAFAYVFFGFWYLFLACMFLASGGLFSQTAGGPPLLFISVFLLAPLAMHYGFTRHSEDNLESLLLFLQNEAEFSVVEEHSNLPDFGSSGFR